MRMHEYENACDLKGVHILQTDMNTEYKHIASYQYEAAWIRKGVFFVQLDMNTEYYGYQAASPINTLSTGK